MSEYLSRLRDDIDMLHDEFASMTGEAYKMFQDLEPVNVLRIMSERIYDHLGEDRTHLIGSPVPKPSVPVNTKEGE